MNPILNSIGVACITVALILEVGSYYKQIKKTLRTKKSSQVSSSAYMLKVVKYLITMVGLGIYVNWVGFFMEIVSLIACGVCLWLIVYYKPKGWKLF